MFDAYQLDHKSGIEINVHLPSKIPYKITFYRFMCGEEELKL